MTTRTVCRALHKTAALSDYKSELIGGGLGAGAGLLLNRYLLKNKDWQSNVLSALLGGGLGAGAGYGYDQWQDYRQGLKSGVAPSATPVAEPSTTTTESPEEQKAWGRNTDGTKAFSAYAGKRVGNGIAAVFAARRAMKLQLELQRKQREYAKFMRNLSPKAHMPQEAFDRFVRSDRYKF